MKNKTNKIKYFFLTKSFNPKYFIPFITVLFVFFIVCAYFSMIYEIEMLGFVTSTIVFVIAWLILAAVDIMAWILIKK